VADHSERQTGTETQTGRHIPCPTCAAPAYLELVMGPDRNTGKVYHIYTCNRCGRVIWSPPQ
jgi:DNA-directed RNA polymerase subunit RPC12/RpoP